MISLSLAPCLEIVMNFFSLLFSCLSMKEGRLFVLFCTVEISQTTMPFARLLVSLESSMF
jgi:hypothetical protein